MAPSPLELALCGKSWIRHRNNELRLRKLQTCKIVPPKKLSFRLSFSLSDMTNYKSAFGKVCRIKNRHTFRILPILKSAYFKSMPILNSSYHAVKYAELRIGSILKVCRFVIRHITQTETQTETEANFTHCKIIEFFRF